MSVSIEVHQHSKRAMLGQRRPQLVAAGIAAVLLVSVLIRRSIRGSGASSSVLAIAIVATIVVIGLGGAYGRRHWRQVAGTTPKPYLLAIGSYATVWNFLGTGHPHQPMNFWRRDLRLGDSTAVISLGQEIPAIAFVAAPGPDPGTLQLPPELCIEIHAQGDQIRELKLKSGLREVTLVGRGSLSAFLRDWDDVASS